ncbi:urease accessory UreF family protein [soil metagenome]|jgi:urease accessory protein
MSTVLSMLLADGRFPAGSYAHSLGLEQAVADGLPAAAVSDFIAARLRLVAEPEARIAVAARRAVLADGVTGALHVEDEFCARCPSPVLRDSARRLGSALLRSASGVWPADSLVHDYRAASTATPRPVALGVVAAAVGVGDEQLAALALYDDAATVSSAALKLLALDPARASRWVAQLAPSIEDAARVVAVDTRPLCEQPSAAAVGLELAAAVHHDRRERLFVS